MTLSSIGAKRLLKLAAHLEKNVPPLMFDMGTWYSSAPPDWQCGFAGCAIGWAIHDKLFDGLHWTPLNIPVYRNGSKGLDAVAILFGISRDDAFILFGASRKSRTDVVLELRDFVRANR